MPSNWAWLVIAKSKKIITSPERIISTRIFQKATRFRSIPLLSAKGGYITIITDAGTRNVQLNRIHLEEDAGKLLHDQDPDNSNRKTAPAPLPNWIWATG